MKGTWPPGAKRHPLHTPRQEWPNVLTGLSLGEIREPSGGVPRTTRSWRVQERLNHTPAVSTKVEAVVKSCCVKIDFISHFPSPVWSIIQSQRDTQCFLEQKVGLAKALPPHSVQRWTIFSGWLFPVCRHE